MTKSSQVGLAFMEEAREELLPELENGLLELSKNPEEAALINRVFRALHTLKGSGAMFGFDRLSGLAHEMETVFEAVRNGQCRVDNALVQLGLTATDHLRFLIDEPEAVSDAAIEELQWSFRKISPEAVAGELPAEPEAAENEEDEAGWRAYHIRFKPRTELFANGTNPLFLLDELYELGTARVIAHFNGVPLLEELHPEACYTWWDMILATDQGVNTLRDVFIFVEDECDLLSITKIAEDLQSGQETAVFDELEHLLTRREEITPAALKNAFAESTRATGTDESKGKGDTAATTGESPRTPQKPSSNRPGESRTISSMRIQATKLDQLVNLVGELVIAQTRLTRLAEEKEDHALTEIAETMERLTNDLRDNTLDIRMMPIGTSFGKFKRVVWDFSSAKGKAVELITEGAATELDKTVIERLDDPLVHLLRNSIDHGIESPEERKSAGKPRQGKIVFSAEHSGGNVIITIADDGRGIDPEALRAKAVEKGLLTADVVPEEKTLLKLIFEPGFSTAARVSDLSGRGVGMDVVKQNITALRGKVRVSSEKGAGTTVRMTIPLTLAIIDGLQVRINAEHFIIPLAVVSECLELDQQTVDSNHRRRFIHFREQLVPFLRLREWFSINGNKPEREQVVIVSAEKKLVGLIVDEVVGLQQTVIKNLGQNHKEVPGISGATIQGDGSLALILDVDPLVLRAQEAQE